jgi:ATP-binding protein involved in chromosome partitioning
VALTVAGCPLRTEITRRVTDAVMPLDGVDAVDVELTVMSDEQRQELAQRLRSEQGAHGHDHAHDHGDAHGHAHAARTNPFTDSRTRVLAISSGKGGVGKSSVTTNLAVALAQRGHKVAAVDADVWGFSMPRMLGIDRPPTVIDDVILPPEANGVSLISMGFFAREDQPVVWRGPMLHKALEQFLTDVRWDEPDFLIVDMPPGTGDIAISMAQFLPRAEVIVVTTPQPAAQRVAQRAAYMARKVNLSVVGVIENMSWFRCDHGEAYKIFGEGGGLELAEDLDVPLLGQVPLVPELREGSDMGAPIVVAKPDDEASQVFRAVAERIDVELAPKKIYRPELKIV